MYCCLLASRFVFFLSHVVSAPAILFCPFLFFVETKAFYSYLSLIENNVGLLGLPHLTLLGLWTFKNLSLIVILCTNSHWVGPLGPSKAPPPYFFFSFSLSLLKRAISPWLALPHCPWVNVIYSLFFMDISSFWAFGA